MNNYLTKDKRILFFVDGFVGGAGNVVQILSKRFAEDGCAVEICCLGGTTKGRHDLTDVKIVGIKKKSSRALNYLNQAISAKRMIKQFNPDCVISFLFGISAFVGVFVGKRRNYLFITSERSDPSALKPHGLLKGLLHSAYNKADGIVVLFDAFKNLEDGKYENKCYTIPNPVPKINCGNKSIKTDKSVNFVTVANESFPKGLDLLIDAFALAVRQIPELQLNIYGKMHTDKLPKRIEQYNLEGNVHLMGYTDSIESALDGADIYIMPSRHEGFPNSLCEAMSAGIACIAYKCHNGMTELIKNNYNGVLIPPEDVQMMADQIVALAKDRGRVKKLGENALRISQEYSLDSIVKKWDDLLFELETNK